MQNKDDKIKIGLKHWYTLIFRVKVSLQNVKVKTIFDAIADMQNEHDSLGII